MRPCVFDSTVSISNEYDGYLLGKKGPYRYTPTVEQIKNKRRHNRWMNHCRRVQLELFVVKGHRLSWASILRIASASYRNITKENAE